MTCIPGVCVNSEAPLWEWYIAPPPRYPPYVVRITAGAANAPFERHRMVVISFRSW